MDKLAPRQVIVNKQSVDFNLSETSGDIKITRPEIYFGERTDTDVYVKTKQREFDYPQGENNNYTNYDGSGGFAVGSGLRRLAIAWDTDDLSKLPFSDDVTQILKRL